MMDILPGSSLSWSLLLANFVVCGLILFITNIYASFIERGQEAKNEKRLMHMAAKVAGRMDGKIRKRKDEAQAAELRRKQVNGQLRELKSRIAELDARPNRLIRIIGTENSKAMRFEGAVMNQLVADHVKRGTRHPFLYENWAHPQIVEVWAYSMQDARELVGHHFSQSLGYRIVNMTVGDDPYRKARETLTKVVRPAATEETERQAQETKAAQEKELADVPAPKQDEPVPERISEEAA